MTATKALPEPLRGIIEPEELDFLFDDFGVDVSSARTLHEPGPAGEAAVLIAHVQPGQGAAPATIPALNAAAVAARAPDGALVLDTEGRHPEERLAAWRNGLWPLLHTGLIYEVRKLEASRRTLSGLTTLEKGPKKAHKARSGTIFVIRRPVHAMGPDAPTEKLGADAPGWNGEVGKAS